ncbi:MAG: glutamine amidotransferase [Bacteroidia bacterium]|nr:glutamine amidotransferase [Bacteroidia bacterium]NNF32398.1 glutamine amidotransferase [Flavobacteriaceae bacterium]NNJ82402.1 glutamine amidotransferase [Flavobacteriaceae bacterium]NNK55438.1 glutamine amidotransferase [Flavobacteriaceae bacterium]
MKKILILQMRPETDIADSEYEAILKVGKIDQAQVHRIRVEQAENFDFKLNNYCAIIAGGSPFDVSCPEENKGEMQNRVESFFNSLFNQIIPIDFPFLGACSGNGLLGSYCGTTISGKYSEPVGAVTVTVTKEGAEDPILNGLPQKFSALVGHKEACDELPQNAVLLASSELCPIQMFRIKNNIYATQFHPEADAEEFILRISAYKDHGYFPPEDADTLVSSLKDIQTPVAEKILNRFVDRYSNH